MTSREVLHGFEASHAEWVRIGGETFRKLHRFAPGESFYRSRYWKLVRQAVLEWSGSKCFRCSGHADLVHHLNYDFVGEDHLHPETLVAICRPCHGVVEYARKAEVLMSRISRRISLCRGFLEDARGCRDQNAAHVYARLLEYRDELAELRNLFLTKTQYRNARIGASGASEAVVARFQVERAAYEERAVREISEWAGSEKEKAERLPPLLESEMQNCRKFVAEVFQPVLPCDSQTGPMTEATPSTSPGSKPLRPGKECLVVGVKFRRGHVDGIGQGDTVRLVREPDNDYDPNAIRVDLQTGEALGYLTREFASTFAQHMDGAICVQAHVSRIVADKIYVEIVAGNSVV